MVAPARPFVSLAAHRAIVARGFGEEISADAAATVFGEGVGVGVGGGGGDEAGAVEGRDRDGGGGGLSDGMGGLAGEGTADGDGGSGGGSNQFEIGGLGPGGMMMDNGPDGFAPPRSRHPSGVNVAMADGSTAFVNDTITLLTWQQLGAWNDGAVTSLP